MSQRITSPFGTVFIHSDEHPNVFEQIFGARRPFASETPSAMTPPVDIYEDDRVYTVTMNLPRRGEGKNTGVF